MSKIESKVKSANRICEMFGLLNAYREPQQAALEAIAHAQRQAIEATLGYAADNSIIVYDINEHATLDKDGIYALINSPELKVI